jgi:hypothetical protein
LIKKCVYFIQFPHEDEPLSHAIITNSKALVEAQYFLFETLWNKAIPAQEKITEIEEGMKPPFIETLRDPHEIQKLGLDLVNSGQVRRIISTILYSQFISPSARDWFHPTVKRRGIAE